MQGGKRRGQGGVRTAGEGGSLSPDLQLLSWPLCYCSPTHTHTHTHITHTGTHDTQSAISKGLVPSFTKVLNGYFGLILQLVVLSLGTVLINRADMIPFLMELDRLEKE